MATYSTSSGFSDLDGTCEISDDDVKSYTSNTLGPARVKNNGSSLSLNFRLKFDSGDVYGILATGDVYSFNGTAAHTGSPNDEPWTCNRIPN